MFWFLVILPDERYYSAPALLLYIRVYCLIWVLCVVLPVFLSVPASHGTIPDGLDHFQWLQSDIFPSFGFIVRVNLFQRSVKYRSELFYGIGILANSISHWCLHFAFSSINTGAAEYSQICAPVSAQALPILFQHYRQSALHQMR